MAGALPTAQRRGGRRALDAALNLVPFIDLLSCCIAFLLITACWTQLARMPVERAERGGWDRPGEPPPPRPTLTIAPDGYTLERAGAVVEIPRARGEYDLERLARELRSAHALLPEGIGASLRARDGVSYRELVRALDALRSARFDDVDLDAA